MKNDLIEKHFNDVTKELGIHERTLLKNQSGEAKSYLKKDKEKIVNKIFKKLLK